jgi:thymidylate synthase (FAD)
MDLKSSSEVRLISITPKAEELILYCARVSSKNQNSKDTRLIEYLIKHNHWSPFEMAHMVVEIKTTRAISAQILRHKSFSFQELSQRYTSVSDFFLADGRYQSAKNRQASYEELKEEDNEKFKELQRQIITYSYEAYKKALKMGVAREQARFLLPLSTMSKLYMAGNIRSFIHYVLVRTQEDTQKEHREIAEKIKEIMKRELPIISQALGWTLDNINYYL